MRPTSPAFVLICLAALLVVWPLTLQKPGLPTWLKADEPAYYLAARSLWEDHDLRCETKDLARAYEEFLVDPDNLILLSRDGWRTVYYGKPYFTSLLVSPLVAAFGANGFVAFNMACLFLAIACGYLLLRERNGEGESLLFAAGYFLVSTSFAYVFWLQPECSSLAGVAAALYLSLGTPAAGEAPATRRGRLSGWLLGSRARLVWAGLLLGPAINAKPVHLVAVIPAAFFLLHRRRFAPLLLFALATAIGVGAVAAGQKALTGAWSPYLGVERGGFNIRNPEVLPSDALIQPGRTSAAKVKPAGSWHWIFRVPELDPRVGRDLQYYFVGRHTGVFLFYPFFLVVVVLFLAGRGWRDAGRVGALLALALFILFFVVFDPFNYQGGGGFIGNRYFVGAYPLGLALVGRLRPRLLTLLGYLLGGLFIGQVLFAPLGPPVDEPTLQAYARARPFRFFPFEFTLNEIPGYRGVAQAGAWIQGRKDRVRHDGEWMTIVGAGRTELLFRREQPLRSAAFLLRSFAPGNRVTIRSGGRKFRVEFPDAPPPPGGASAMAVVDLGEPDESFQYWYDQPRQYAWYVEIEAERAASPSWWGLGAKLPIGVRLIHLGTKEVLERDVYGGAWEDVAAPSAVAAGEPVRVSACLVNRSGLTWSHDSPARVQVGYRWIGPLENPDSAPGVEGRSPLELPVRPGEPASVEVAAVAPEPPGDYLLVLEPVHEYIRWFGGVDPESRREVPIRVLPPVAAAR